ncbi:Ribokinase-like protein [Lophiostoma macrostomum CBS 122681]|uniref:Ribokinase-like protein n=1 Tax=Lophiostoma macrostomum CBS 122681 TaxID=1314788 RepID=A0A6A6TFA0_9PLEO|nr:Ribokinase-like protein [Lophiostoma macrostomum CBS 122681]
MSPKIISVIGVLDYDLIMTANRIPTGGESLMANTYLETLGGKGANTAIAAYRTCHSRVDNAFQIPVTDERSQRRDEGDELQRKAHSADTTNQQLQIKVKMIGAVGDDEYGELLSAGLNKNGVDSSGVVTVPNTQSSVCFVMVKDHTRENRCLFTRGATATWKREHLIRIEALGNGTRPDLCIAQMEIHKEVVEQMIETAGRAGIDFVLNAAPANPLTKCTYQWITHLLMNESEAAIMSGRDKGEVNMYTWPIICDKFLEYGAKNVIITLGAKGAYYANARERGHCLGYEIEVVDTTGAGDTFTGAYSSPYLRQKEAGQ